MKFIDLFAGIGGFRRGMELAGHECVGLCESDKFALASYTAMHLITEDQREYLQTLPLKKRQKEILKEEYRNGEWYADDIRSVDARSMPGADCWCFGFPCQDISVAGNCLGFAGKRSSLFFAVTSLIRDIPEEDRPSYLVIENVKNLLSVNRGFDFAKLLAELDEIGYDAEWDVLNSKNFGVPQNRERVYIVGHLRGRGTRKVFPLGETDGVHDTSETDGKVYEVAQCLTYGGNDKWQGDYVKQIGNCRTISMTHRSFHQTDISPTLTASGPSKGRGNNSPVPGVAIPILSPDRKVKRQNGRRFKENGEPMFTLTSQDRHGVVVSGIYTGASKDFIREPMEGISRCIKSEKHDAGVLIREATKKGYAIAGLGDSINLNHPNSKTRRGRVGKGVANTLDTGCNQGVINHYLGDEFRIRRLTPRECFRLQGWTDDYFEKAQSINSDSQLYKQAGNGVTVNVIQAIAEKLVN